MYINPSVYQDTFTSTSILHENLIFYEISKCLKNVWLQVGVEPMPLAFWVSTLTTRPPRPAILPAPFTFSNHHCSPLFAWRHSPPVKCLSSYEYLIFYRISICWKNVWLQVGVKPTPLTFHSTVLLTY